MPLTRRHAHPERGLIDEIGDMIDHVKVELVKKSPQNANGGGSSGDDDDEAAMPTAIEKPTNTRMGPVTGISKATGQARPQPNDDVLDDPAASTQALSAPTQTSSDQSTTSEEVGLGAGAIAGIVFGVLGGVLLISGIVYFAFARGKKDKKHSSAGQEKFVPVRGPPPPLPLKDTGLSASKPSRLSLRPVTQFFPNMNSGKPNNPNAPSGVPPPAWRSPAPAPFERPSTSHSTNPSNPFGNQAERAASPFVEEHNMQIRSTPPTPDRNAKPLPPGGRQTSMYEVEPNMDFTLPDRGAPSPTGTVFSMTSVGPDSPAPHSNGAAAIAAAGGPRNTAVHRVQLDFKPSLGDEMELNAGELVRLLHEYDDGWALCIRLDRSRQGVVPRTCLSNRPVKPRPQQGGPRGPPVNPQRPESPVTPRTPASPGYTQGPMRSQSPMGRPMSLGGRAQSPGPRQQQPAGWPSASSRAHGPSPMNPAARPPHSPSFGY